MIYLTPYKLCVFFYRSQLTLDDLFRKILFCIFLHGQVDKNLKTAYIFDSRISTKQCHLSGMNEKQHNQVPETTFLIEVTHRSQNFICQWDIVWHITKKIKTQDHLFISCKKKSSICCFAYHIPTFSYPRIIKP